MKVVCSGRIMMTDREHGFSEGYLRARLGHILFTLFTEWIYGQTVVLDDNLETVYFPQDVQRFLDGGKVLD